MNLKHIIIPAAAAALSLTAGLTAGGGGGYLAGHTAAATAAEEQIAQCQYALEESGRVLSLTAEALGLAGEAIVAASSWDAVEMGRINSEIERIDSEIGDPDEFHAASAICNGEDA